MVGFTENISAFDEKERIRQLSFFLILFILWVKKIGNLSLPWFRFPTFGLKFHMLLFLAK